MKITITTTTQLRTHSDVAAVMERDTESPTYEILFHDPSSPSVHYPKSIVLIIQITN